MIMLMILTFYLSNRKYFILIVYYHQFLKGIRKESIKDKNEIFIQFFVYAIRITMKNQTPSIHINHII